MHISGLLLLELFLVHEGLNVHDPITMIVFFLTTELVLGIRALLISFPYDALGDCFFHEIDL